MRLTLVLLAIFAAGCSSSPVSSLQSEGGTAHYTVSTTLEILKPVNIAAMTTDAQTAQVLGETDATVKVKVTVDPTADQLASLTPNPRWQAEDAADPALQPYLAPGLTTNWDEAMRSELLAALKQDGIDPEALTDVALVEQVSSWIFAGQRFKFLDHFISYDVDFAGGRVEVIPELRPNFDYEKQKNHVASDDEALALGIYGKSMFRARTFGNCTASATLQATVLKALGIPTRLVLDVPAVDANDPTQLDQARDHIHQFGLRKTIMEGFGTGAASWSSHTFNEVYVGKRWVRLNYNHLGQQPADAQFLGLMVQIQRMADWSEANMGPTWGVHAQVRRLAELSSQNPYRSLAVQDDAAALNPANNPPVPFPEMRVLTLKEGGSADTAALPAEIRQALGATSFFVAFEHGTEIPAYPYLALFRQHVSRRFLLKAAGHPDVPASEDGSWLQDHAVGVRISPDNMNAMAPGVAYTLHPETAAGDYRWDVAPGLELVRPSGVPVPGTPGGSALDKTATVVRATVATPAELQCAPARLCIILALAEVYTGFEPLQNFYLHVGRNFTLQAESQTALTATLYGFTSVDNGAHAGFTLMLDEASSAAMRPGVAYRVLYQDANQGEYRWIFPAGLAVVR